MLASPDQCKSTAQDQVNGPLYRRRDLVQEYSSANLTPPEITVLVRYSSCVQNQRVLDLGCGAGRLASSLRPHTDHYCGLDVSPHMVRHCRSMFPEMRFEQGDMRALPFGDGCFDTVMAVYNLFDAVSHDDRLHVLAQVRRVLTPGGLLIFSSHNRNNRSASEGPRLQFQRNPLNQLRAVMEFLRAQSNRRRIARLQANESEYAIINDCGHNFAVLHYYIDRQSQARQLAAAGFKLIECLNELGCTLHPGDDDSANTTIHYVARKIS